MKHSRTRFLKGQPRVHGLGLLGGVLIASFSSQAPVNGEEPFAGEKTVARVEVEQAPALYVSGSDGDFVEWRAKIGGSGGPITIAGDKVLVGTNNANPRNKKQRDDRGVLMCFDRTDGAFLWQATHARLGSRFEDMPMMALASQPTVDSGRVYYVSNRGELMCVDVEGFRDGENRGPFLTEMQTTPTDADIVWKLDMVAELGIYKRSEAGIGNPLPSPLVLGDLVYCVTSNGARFEEVPHPTAPSFIAVDKLSGEVVWTNSAPGENIVLGQWSSPVVVKLEDQTQILFPGGDGCLYALHPRTGQLLWTIDLGGPAPVSSGPQGIGRRNYFFAKPTAHKNMVYVGLNQRPEDSRLLTRRPLYAIELAKQGAKFIPRIKWRFDAPGFQGTYGAAVVTDGTVFVTSRSGNSGNIFAIDAETGVERWRSQLPDYPALFSSPYVHEGYLYVATVTDLYVFSLKSAPQCVARLEFDAMLEHSNPVVRGDRLYVAADGLWELQMPWLSDHD